ncbi:uncharacterized protein LOC129393170 [Pan paniscus]|uniref:uncharacterized protein LOC129393170 n=1 Tax=Pan paniscus TaxID=9597 RepID=UPI0024367E92|nr:uncharacterized protein LOC129393170 [Pan paniscus]
MGGPERRGGKRLGGPGERWRSDGENRGEERGSDGENREEARARKRQGYLRGGMSRRGSPGVLARWGGGGRDMAVGTSIRKISELSTFGFVLNGTWQRESPEAPSGVVLPLSCRTGPGVPSEAWVQCDHFLSAPPPPNSAARHPLECRGRNGWVPARLLSPRAPRGVGGVPAAAMRDAAGVRGVPAWRLQGGPAAPRVSAGRFLKRVSCARMCCRLPACDKNENQNGSQALPASLRRREGSGSGDSGMSAAPRRGLRASLPCNVEAAL